MSEILDGSAKFEKVQVARNDRLSMPVNSSRSIISFTNPTGGNAETIVEFMPAPSDGWIIVYNFSVSNGGGIEITVEGTVGMCTSTGKTPHAGGGWLLFPIAKGQRFRIRTYLATVEFNSNVLFVPAQSTR